MILKPKEPNEKDKTWAFGYNEASWDYGRYGQGRWPRHSRGDDQQAPMWGDDDSKYSLSDKGISANNRQKAKIPRIQRRCYCCHRYMDSVYSYAKRVNLSEHYRRTKSKNIRAKYATDVRVHHSETVHEY